MPPSCWAAYTAIRGASSQGCRGEEAEGGDGAGGVESRIRAEGVGTEVRGIPGSEDLCHLHEKDGHWERGAASRRRCTKWNEGKRNVKSIIGPVWVVHCVLYGISHTCDATSTHPCTLLRTKQSHPLNSRAFTVNTTQQLVTLFPRQRCPP